MWKKNLMKNMIPFPQKIHITTNFANNFIKFMDLLKLYTPRSKKKHAVEETVEEREGWEKKEKISTETHPHFSFPRNERMKELSTMREERKEHSASGFTKLL